MKLSAPKMVTWVIAAILGLLGLLGVLVPGTGLSAFAFWLVLVGLLLLLIGTTVEGM